MCRAQLSGAERGSACQMSPPTCPTRGREPGGVRELSGGTLKSQSHVTVPTLPVGAVSTPARVPWPV